VRVATHEVKYLNIIFFEKIKLAKEYIKNKFISIHREMKNKTGPDSFLQDARTISDKSFVASVFSLLATQGILIIFYSANGIITARFLGPEGKGIYTICLLIPAIASIFLSINIRSANTYLAGKNEHSPSALLSYSFFMVILITIFSFILFFILPENFIVKIIPNFPSKLWILVGILLPLSMSTNFLLGLLLGWHRVGFMNFAQIIQALSTFLLLLILLVFLGKTSFYAVTAVVLGTLAANVFVVVPLFREGTTLSHLIPGSLVKENLIFGIKGYAGNLFQFFNYRFDIFLVNYFLNASQVGLYVVAVSLAELLWHLPNSVASILFSHVARQQDKYSLLTVERIFRLTLSIVGLGILCLVFFSKNIIVFLFGKSFAESYPALLWLLPGVFFLSMSKVMTGYLNGRGYPQYGSISSFVAFFVTIAADIYLIPKLGIKGAAMASSLSYATGTFIVLFFFLKKTSTSIPALFTLRSEDCGMLFNILRGLRQ
jgi:O-antigen/teichoic acid export membrane protein